MATIGIRALRVGFRALETASPELAARLAERLFFAPTRRPLSGQDIAVLAAGDAFDVRSEGRRLRAWRWGAGPVVLLVHGWGGRAGRFSAFIPPLVAGGHTVVAYDGPGHGASEGRLSSMPELARALAAVAAEVGPVHGVIAHSLGGAATSLALRDGLTARRVALLAPVADPGVFAEAFATSMGVRRRTIEALRRNSERRINFRWADLNVPAMAARLTLPALVVHDRDDDVVSIHDGRAIAAAWRGAELVVTTGLGHRGVLRDPATVRRAVDFVAAPPAST
jgi:pimeloyl-ACP methyl ester carboxylesterase